MVLVYLQIQRIINSFFGVKSKLFFHSILKSYVAFTKIMGYFVS